jgi:hypothetical protein
MEHLKLQHGNMSLKMKFREMEYPGNGQAGDGFNHMIEVEKGDEEDVETAVNVQPTVGKEDRIAILEAELGETKKRLEIASKLNNSK